MSDLMLFKLLSILMKTNIIFLNRGNIKTAGVTGIDYEQILLLATIVVGVIRRGFILVRYFLKRHHTNVRILTLN